MLPTLSELAAKQDWKEFGATVERALRILIALTLPIAAVMAAGINPLVRAVFGFDESITTFINLDNPRLSRHIDGIRHPRR
jgi:O-antigen/teichoic acid export membrane protein